MMPALLASQLNITQQVEVQNALYGFAGSFTAPLFLVESFMMGALCAYVPIGSYMLWHTLRPSLTRTVFISTMCITLATLVAHWAASLRHLESMVTGHALEPSLPYMDNIPPEVYDDENTSTAYTFFVISWRYLLPLLSETALLGFSSALFATACMILWQTRPRQRSYIAMAIPLLAATMYTLSLVHWAVSLWFYSYNIDVASEAVVGVFQRLAAGTHFNPLELITALLSTNIVLSDCIVIWRMCIVWNKARPAVIFGLALAATVLGLNITNFVFLYSHGGKGSSLPSSISIHAEGEEGILKFGFDSVGLATVFMSLGSNVCATVLVGAKAWLHRRQLNEHICFSSRRTLALRVLELLAESSVVYSALWTVSCISLFRSITSYPVGLGLSVHAAAHLDAAMAQITSIYPLMIFILVALDKIHYSRAPQILSNVEIVPGSGGRPREIVSVTLDGDVERSRLRSLASAHPMLALNHHDCRGDDDASVKLFNARDS